jgi:hypothetical protein
MASLCGREKCNGIYETQIEAQKCACYEYVGGYKGRNGNCAMNTNGIPNSMIAPPANAPAWVAILGGCLLGISFIYLLILGVSNNKPDKTARGFIAIAIAIALAVGFGLIGGYAKAEGQIPISESISPITFGVGGGIAVFIIVYLILYNTLVKEPKPPVPPPVNVGAISMNIEPNTTLREAIEAAAKGARKTVVYLPVNDKFDSLILKECELSAESVEQFIEELALHLTGGASITYQVEIKPGTNVIQIKT